jgi:hypothetical protein
MGYLVMLLPDCAAYSWIIDAAGADLQYCQCQWEMLEGVELPQLVGKPLCRLAVPQWDTVHFGHMALCIPLCILSCVLFSSRLKLGADLRFESSVAHSMKPDS